MNKQLTRYFLYFLALPLLWSCGNDDEPSRENNLQGTWEIQSSELEGYSFTGSFLFFSGEIDQDNIRNIPVISDYANDLEDTLKAAVDEALPPGTTINLNDGSDFSISSSSFLNGNGDWSAADDRLNLNFTIDDQAFGLDYTINQLTDRQMVLGLTVNEQTLADLVGEVIELNYEGVTVDEYSVSYTFLLNKQ
jgi:hypothetical protein